MTLKLLYNFLIFYFLLITPNVSRVFKAYMMSKVDLASLSNWSCCNHMDFNLEKCASLSFGTESTSTSTYSLCDCLLSRESTYKDLGVIMSSNLNWSNHHSYIVASAYQMLSLTRCSFRSVLSSYAKKHPYVTLVRSKLLYCSQIWRLQDPSP